MFVGVCGFVCLGLVGWVCWVCGGPHLKRFAGRGETEVELPTHPVAAFGFPTVVL